MSETTQPGTYRVTNGQRVSFADAIRAWGTPAYDLLIATARHYNRTVSYKELAEHVQDASGIRTNIPAGTMVSKLLEVCSARAAEMGEPPLTSLALRQDGTVGATYWRTPTAPNVELPTVTADADVEMHAAEHRLLCYRKFAKDLPEDGGTPTLATSLREKRVREQEKADRAMLAGKTSDEPRPICPSCFTELPANGKCWQCD